MDTYKQFVHSALSELESEPSLNVKVVREVYDARKFSQVQDRPGAQRVNEVRVDLLLRTKEKEWVVEKRQKQEEDAQINEKLNTNELDGLDDRILRSLAEQLGRAIERISSATNMKRAAHQEPGVSRVGHGPGEGPWMRYRQELGAHVGQEWVGRSNSRAHFLRYGIEAAVGTYRFRVRRLV